MARSLTVLGIALTAVLLTVAPLGDVARASGGNNDVQTVALHRQDCSATSVGATVGSARFSLDDQGGGNVNANGIEIKVSVTAGQPRSSYGTFVVDASCQVLASGGTLATDDSGRGDLEFHVLGSVVPPGTVVRVELVDPANATVPGPGPFVDVITSDPTSAP